MKWIAKIVNIGAQALEPKTKMVILFGENVNQDLKKVAITQRFAQATSLNDFIFKKGDTITIAGQTYAATFVGAMTQSNMKTMGHVTLYFGQKVPQNPLGNAIYLQLPGAQLLPKFKVNDEIIYEHI
ncbi:PTS sorbitol transporter subunit IIA [Lactobacillus sp. ESL0785]|uniref:PTS glucitol/sorbitol transporter subunit IIA n=1 Tax=Lactobacillus sp. ESL0785 TaxID=2983232 RepID=UPI0023F8DDE7|nr:PTS glucitol/sorbitol transporter subunit IIA [Lactobacillus sp. ESL0785]WEV71362.1 PTS sorbitol transporter subunit IIA [Lactobacillus sp. ESL0785]